MAKYKIVIPKKGKNAGTIEVEGMQQTQNCVQNITEIALNFGEVDSVTQKQNSDSESQEVFRNIDLQ